MYRGIQDTRAEIRVPAAHNRGVCSLLFFQTCCRDLYIGCCVAADELTSTAAPQPALRHCGCPAFVSTPDAASAPRCGTFSTALWGLLRLSVLTISCCFALHYVAVPLTLHTRCDLAVPRLPFFPPAHQTHAAAALVIARYDKHRLCNCCPMDQQVCGRT